MYKNGRTFSLNYLFTDAVMPSIGAYLKPDLQGDVLYLQVQHFNANKEFLHPSNPLVKKTPKTERHLLQEGDVVFAAKGFNIFAAVYHVEDGPVIASSSFMVLRLKRQPLLTPDYLAWFLNTSPQISKLHKSKTTTTIPSISIKDLDEVQIPVPPLHIQETIVAVSNLKKKQEAIERRLQELKSVLNKQTLLKAAYK